MVSSEIQSVVNVFLFDIIDNRAEDNVQVIVSREFVFSCESFENVCHPNCYHLSLFVYIFESKQYEREIYIIKGEKQSQQKNISTARRFLSSYPR